MAKPAASLADRGAAALVARVFGDKEAQGDA